MKKIYLGLAIVAALGVLQFFSPTVINPPATKKLAVPAGVETILRESCFDCHSNESNFPWYSKVIPVSWLIYYDVTEGRKELNFSEWTYSEEKSAKKLHEIREEAIEEGEMPLGIYVLMHPSAELTKEEKATLEKWLSTVFTGSSEAHEDEKEDDEEH